MATNRDIQLQRQEQSAQKEPTRDIPMGYIVQVDGDIDGDIPQRLWIQGIGNNAHVVQVLNPGIIQRASPGMLVFYERDPKEPSKWQLTKFRKSFYADDLTKFASLPDNTVEPHAPEHIYRPGNPGADPLDVYPRALTEFRVTPTSPASMKVRISGGWYPGTTNYERFNGPVDSKDFTSDVPSTSGKALIVAITLSKSGTIEYTNGTEYVDGLPVPSAAWPSVAINKALLSAVRLVNGMTTITETNFDKEIRPLVGVSGLASASELAIKHVAWLEAEIDLVLSKHVVEGV